MAKQTRFPTCQQPDHDVPGIKCGCPLPCPWHTAVIDLGSTPPTLNIPITGNAAIEGQDRLKDIGRVLSEPEDDS